MRYKIILFSIVLMLLQGCSNSSDSIHVGRYESIPWGFRTNSWWVVGPEAVVLINTQFLPSAIKEAVEMIENCTGKKVVMAFVLHANPDKFNGTKYLTEKGIKVVTSEQVRNRIPEVDALRRSWFYERYKPDYPEKLVLPESIGSENTTIEAAGMKFKVHILGPSVSKDHIAVTVDDHLFAGDVLANEHHSWLELGKIDEWLKTLEFLQSLNPKHLYPGRGKASDSELIKKQMKYLNDFRETVRKIKQQGEYNEERKELVIEQLDKLYPDYGNSFFMNMGVEAVWESLSKE